MTTLLSWTLCGERDASILADTLRAVAPIVDACLAVWTGSAMPPIEWAQDVIDRRVHVYRRDWLWRDDFAAARNAALTFASELARPSDPSIGRTCAAWGIMLDSDERIICHDPSSLRMWLDALPASVGVVVCQAADGSHGRERIFRLPCQHKWIGRTHESIPVGPGQQASAPPDLISWAERPKSHEQLAAKFARDEALLAAEIAEHPDDPRWHAYRGASLAGLQRFEEAVEEYRAAAMLGFGEDSVTACFRAAEILIHTKHPDEAIAAAVRGMALNATYGELPWIAGVAAMHMGRPDQALAWGRIAEVHGEKGIGRAALGQRVGHRNAQGLRDGPGQLQRAAKAAQAPRDKVRAVVFSKDRPMQLDACLRSLKMHCADLEDLAVHVICKATSQPMADAYAEVDAAHQWATLHPERDFRSEVMLHLDRCEHVLFIVDDTIFVRRFTIGDMVSALDASSDAIGVSLRLGGNCVRCYPTNSEQEKPPGLGPAPRGLCSFDWYGADGDFGYPLEVSSSLYQSAHMTGLLRDERFSNPNELEALIAGLAARDVLSQTFHMPDRLLCPPISVAFSVPANRVQSTFANRAGSDASQSPEALLKRWQAGDRIDVAVLAGHTPNACHEEVTYTFERRPRVEIVTRPISITVTSTGFNAAEWAPRCIRSVQSQTFKARHVYVAADHDTLRAAREAERGVGLGAPGIGATSDNVDTSGERLVLEAIAARTSGRVLVLDVGANRGSYTRLARDVIGARAEVYAFEPSPVAAQQIRGAESIFHYALSDAEGTAELHDDIRGSGMSSLHDRPGLLPSIRVQTRTLDDVCSEMGIAHVDLFKIDVEGHELRVLKGARRMLADGAVDAVQFEFGGACVDSRTFLRDFYRLLGDAYQIHRVTPRGIYPVEYSERDEVFVSSNFLAVRREAPLMLGGSDVVDGTGKSLLANLLPVWRSLPDDEVIAWVDGDDWLAHDGALDVVADAHRAGALATYGQFMWGDGTPGFAAPAEADVRQGMWLTTHLKTFRAGLVKRMRESDFRQPNGAYIDLAIDQAIMIPCVEMAAERAVYLPQILYHYNDRHSFAASASPAELSREAAEVRRIRSFRRYGRLAML